MVNGSIFLTLNCNILVGLPSLEATSNRTTCQNTVFRISSLWKFWTEVSFNPCVTSIDHYLSSSLWHNSLIKVDNRPVFYKSWYAKGVKNIAHLMKDSTKLISCHKFENLFGIKSNFLALQGLISVLKSLKQLNRDCFLIRYKKSEDFHESFMRTEKANKVVYERLVRIKKQRPTRSQEKWSDDCELENDVAIDWKSVYRLPFNCTKISNLITFQFKLLLRRPATKDFFKKIGVRNNDRCNFCDVELENLTHLFWFCTITSSFWQNFKQWLINDKNFAAIQETDLTFSIIIGLRSNAFKTKNPSLFFNRKIFHLDLWNTR